MRKFFYYFGWTIVVGVLIYLGDKYQFLLKQDFMKNFEVLSFVLFSSIFPIGIGILLRLPKLIIEMKEDRQWTFDWTKFMGVGLPSLGVLSMCVVIFTPTGENLIPLVPEILYFGNSTIQTIAGVVFGFILLDSVKK